MKERLSNIELLRIVCILGVIVLHYNNKQIGGGLKYVGLGTVNYYILLYLESLFCCAVNVFILVTGYFLSLSKTRNITRIIQLLAQVIFINTGGYFLDVILGKNTLSFRHLVGKMLPANYFVILYCVLFLLSPYLNIIIVQLEKKNMRNFIFLSFCIFSIWSIGVDIFEEIKGESIVGLSTIGIGGSQDGYTIINFMMMYSIGAYIRLIDVKKISRTKILGILILNSLILTIWGYINEVTAWEYCNPFVILEAVLVFILFLKMDIKYSRIINGLSKEVFAVFLLHSFFIRKIGIEGAVTGDTLIMCLHIIMCTVGIFLICWGLGKIYDLFTEPIFRKIKIEWKYM